MKSYYSRQRRKKEKLRRIGLLVAICIFGTFLAWKRLVGLKVAYDASKTEALYINLDHRNDRNEQIQAELGRASIKYTRVRAVYVQPQPGEGDCWGNSYCAGQVGCQLSHMRALQYASSKRSDSILIFEDDFQWLPTVDPKYVKHVLTTITRTYNTWDVIALSLNVLQSKPAMPRLVVRTSLTNSSEVVRIVEAQATQGYLIRGEYIPRVYEAFMNCDILSSPLVAIDSCWKPLQKTGNWFALRPQLGTQRKGFSDIEKRNVSYDFVHEPTSSGQKSRRLRGTSSPDGLNQMEMRALEPSVEFIGQNTRVLDMPPTN